MFLLFYLAAEIEDFNLVFQTIAIILQIRDPLSGRVHVLRMKRVAEVAHNGHLGLHLDGGYIRSKWSSDSLCVCYYTTNKKRKEKKKQITSTTTQKKDKENVNCTSSYYTEM